MSKRRSQAPRQQQPTRRSQGSRNTEGGKKNFLEKFRAPEQTVVSAMPGMRETSRARRNRSRRKKDGMTRWQIFSIIIMVILGLALVGSTILPYIAGGTTSAGHGL